MQGRVFTFIMSAAMLVSLLGLMIAGPVADAFGIQLWFFVAGSVCALMGVGGFLISEVMKMEDQQAQVSPTTAP